MSSAQSRGWGPGWPFTASATHIVRAKAGRNSITLPVRREIAVLVDHLVRHLENARGRPFVQYGCWGYANRAIKGTSIPSNHSWGLAVDLDAPNNGQGLYNHGTMPANAGEIAKLYGFQWGGSTRVGGAYVGMPDPMHFEYMGTPQQAATLTARLTAQGKVLRMEADVKAAFDRINSDMELKAKKNTDDEIAELRAHVDEQFAAVLAAIEALTPGDPA